MDASTVVGLVVLAAVGVAFVLIVGTLVLSRAEDWLGQWPWDDDP